MKALQHNAPKVLGGRPWGCLFWSIWALWLIPMAMMDVINLVIPGSYDTAFGNETIEAYAQRWVMISIGIGTALVLMMMWAEFIGAGPFSGPMRLRGQWIAAAIIGGPAVLFGALIIMGLIIGDTSNSWAVRADISPSLIHPSNYGVMYAMLMIVIVPLAEEIAYRGIGLGYLLVRGMEPAFAIGLVALIWSLSHLQATPLGLVPIFLAGVFFGWLRVRTGSMAAPILAHVSANGIQFVV